MTSEAAAGDLWGKLALQWPLPGVTGTTGEKQQLSEAAPKAEGGRGNTSVSLFPLTPSYRLALAGPGLQAAAPG